MWGNTSKRRTGYYDIYISEINFDNILDTVFNKEHYDFWIKQIEKAAKSITKLTNRKATIKQINDYFKERAVWNEIDGIQYENIPKNENYVYVEGFYYRKRIQLVVYNLLSISKFDYHTGGECI